MTDNDKELLKQAEKLTAINWSNAYKLADKADSKEAKDELIHIAKTLYRKEEYLAGLL
jgi:predicted Zn-ribbon and HTH transcriptional regulator